MKKKRPNTRGAMANKSSQETVKEFSLDELLARMKPETFHADIDFGRPVGKEVW